MTSRVFCLAPLTIAEEIGDLGEAAAEILADLVVDALVSERSGHATQPCVAHAAVDRDVRVSHAETRMTVLRAVFVRTTEPFDEERGERLANARRDLRLRLVHAVKRDELRFVRVHVIVETRRESTRA